MKKLLFALPLLVVVVVVVVLIGQRQSDQPSSQPATLTETDTSETVSEDPTVSIANPASTHCQENGGVLEIITNSDGSQFGLCNLGEYSCEEWVYLNGACTVEEDAQKIEQALSAKGLDLSGMEVVIQKHLGTYLAGSVLPVSVPAGGGYVFATKDTTGAVSIVADGNGAIMCSSLEKYPDFPSYLIPECIDSSGAVVTR